tara:strand:- start:9076 stop:10518 length:1443 start_codon:yes stop_codon:yes gene_type:complete
MMSSHSQKPVGTPAEASSEGPPPAWAGAESATKTEASAGTGQACVEGNTSGKPVPPAPSPARSRAAPAVQELLALRQIVDNGTPLTSLQSKRAAELVKEAIESGCVGESNEFDAARFHLTNTQLKSLGLDAPDPPVIPSNILSMPLPKRLLTVQKLIDQLTYNHVGTTTNFNIDKNRNLNRILETGRSIARDALPIKCVEAVFLALKWTHEWRDVDRIPAAFKTSVSFTDSKGIKRKKTHQHIVLFIRRLLNDKLGDDKKTDNKSNDESQTHHASQYGALGISRRSSLAFRDMSYKSITEILTTYRDAYQELGHSIVKVRTGLPVPRVPREANICWRHCVVGITGEKDGGAGDEDEDDEEEDEEEESTESTEKEKKAFGKTWSEACCVFELHCAASRSRKLFDKWRLDGERWKFTKSTVNTDSGAEEKEAGREVVQSPKSGTAVVSLKPKDECQNKNQKKSDDTIDVAPSKESSPVVVKT